MDEIGRQSTVILQLTGKATIRNILQKTASKELFFFFKNHTKKNNNKKRRRKLRQTQKNISSN